MRILLTGANGFVGSPLLCQLANEHEVLAVDSLRQGSWRGPQHGGSVDLDTSDLRDRAAVDRLVSAFEPEGIVHLAAVHYIPQCEAHPNEAVSINIEATVNLLGATPPGCRFVFASTAAVYAPMDRPHREDDALLPLDVYGHTKLAAEQFVTYYSKARGLDAVILRMFNVVGPGETNPHLVPQLIEQLQSGSRILRLGNLTPTRDYLYVEDAARGFALAVTSPGPEPGRVRTANLGSGQAVSVLEVVNRLSTILDSPIEVVEDPDRIRAIDRATACADNTAIHDMFGWTPQTDLDGALRAIWDGGDVWAHSVPAPSKVS